MKNKIIFTSILLAFFAIKLVSCGGSNDPEKEFKIVPRNDWQKLGLHGTPKEILVLKNQLVLAEYYNFNEKGYLTERGYRRWSSPREFKDLVLEKFEYRDSTVLEERIEYRPNFNNTRHNGYTIYKYNSLGDVISEQPYSIRDTNSDNPEFNAGKLTEYTYTRTGKRTYEKLQDGVLKSRTVFDERRNPIKTTSFDSNGATMNIQQFKYYYNDGGLVTGKIIYEDEDYDLGSDPVPYTLYKYEYDEKGCLTATFWAYCKDLPEGWKKDPLGLGNDLFNHMGESWMMENGKLLVNSFPSTFDSRGNWTFARNGSMGFYIRRDIQYYDQTDMEVYEPVQTDEDYGC